MSAPSASAFDRVAGLLKDPSRFAIGVDGVDVEDLEEEVLPSGGRCHDFTLHGVRASNVYSGGIKEAIRDELGLDVESLLFLHEDVNGTSSEDAYHMVIGQLAGPASSWAMVLEGEVTDMEDEDGGTTLTGQLLESPEDIQAAITRLRLAEIDRIMAASNNRLARTVGDDPQAMAALMQAFRQDATLGPALGRWEAERGRDWMEAATAPAPGRKGPGRL